MTETDALLAEIIALRTLSAFLIGSLIAEADDNVRSATLERLLSGAAKAKLQGFSSEDEELIRARVETCLTNIFVAGGNISRT